MLIIAHSITTCFQKTGFIKSLAFASCKIPVIQATISHNHTANIELIRSAISNSQNSKISIKAVCFVIAARAKNTPDIIIYLMVSFLCDVSWSFM
jgi:hypothetical protein